MGIKYSRKDTIMKVRDDIKNNGIAAIYNAKCIKRSGKTKGENAELYSEIISEELIRRSIIEMFSNIIPITRKRSYRVRHDGETKNKTNREEEIFAKALFNHCNSDYKPKLNDIGRIFDYQVPLKNTKEDKAGKVDLVSYNESKNIVYLLELKCKDNKETLLRCALEIATYYQLLNQKKFIKDYSDELKYSDVEDIKIKKGILIFKDSSQHNEANKIECRPSLKTLIKSLEVEIFVIDDSYGVEHMLL